MMNTSPTLLLINYDFTFNLASYLLQVDIHKYSHLSHFLRVVYLSPTGGLMNAN